MYIWSVQIDLPLVHNLIQSKNFFLSSEIVDTYVIFFSTLGFLQIQYNGPNVTTDVYEILIENV